MIGSIISAANNVKQGYWENAFNLVSSINSLKSRQLQEKAFEWQKYYDQNQTQIRVDDMARAGLNPILAAGGSGASSVSGVSAIPQNTHVTSGQLDQLANALEQRKLQERQLNLQEKVSSDNNKTQKEVAEINASAQKEVAEANIVANRGVKTAQEYMILEQKKKLAHQNEWNDDMGYYDGPPSNAYSFGVEQGRQLQHQKEDRDNRALDELALARREKERKEVRRQIEKQNRRETVKDAKVRRDSPTSVPKSVADEMYGNRYKKRTWK